MGNLRIKNLKFTYNNTTVFDGFNFNLKSNKTLSIIGTSGSGKTTLMNILDNKLTYSGEIYVDGILVNSKNKEELSNIICSVSNDFILDKDNVYDELVSIVKERHYSDDYIANELDSINEFFMLDKLYDKKVNNLCNSEKVLIRILSYCMLNTNYIIIDDLLCYLDYRNKLLLLNYLNSKNIILINITSDIEDVMYTDYILCLYNGKSAIDGKTLDVLSNEKLLKRLGFSLPFMYDLSIQLKLYGLIKKNYLSKEEMVKNLWK